MDANKSSTITFITTNMTKMADINKRTTATSKLYLTKLQLELLNGIYRKVVELRTTLETISRSTKP